VWQFGTGKRKYQWRARLIPSRGVKRVCHFELSSCGRRAKRAGRGRLRNICFATCSLQFAKVGSAATLPQQENNNSVNVQRGGLSFAVMYLRLVRVGGRYLRGGHATAEEC
jgi:hypothetical protein